MLAKKICTRNVAVAEKTESVLQAARRMRKAHVGDLVVVERRNGTASPIGVITDRDIVLGPLATDGARIESLKVAHVMTSHLVTAKDTDSITDVLETMERHGIRRVPLTDGDGGLAGILTYDDIIRELSKELVQLAKVVEKAQAREQRERA